MASVKDKLRLSRDILKYSAEKSSSNEVHNQSKELFFNNFILASNNHNLSLISLMQQLSKLNATNTVQSAELFYFGRKNRASTESGAAKCIAEIFRVLGVPLNKEERSQIVTGNLTIEENSKEFTKKVLNRLDRNWQLARPKHKRDMQLQLEFELATHLKLGTQIQDEENGIAYLPQSSSENLAEQVLGKLASTSIEGRIEKFKEILEALYAHAPNYFKTFTYQLNQACQKTEYQAWFPNVLENVSSTDVNLGQSMKKALLQEVYLGSILVNQNHDLWRSVPKANHAAVLSLLNANALDAIKQPAEQYFGININSDSITFLQNSRSINLKTNTFPQILGKHSSLFELMRNKLEVQNPAIRSLIKKEEALVRIEKYLKTKPSGTKKAFFEALRDKITIEGLSFENIQAVWDNGPISKAGLFKNGFMGRLFKGRNVFSDAPERSGAASCLRDLLEYALLRKLSGPETSQFVRHGVLPQPQATVDSNEVDSTEKLVEQQNIFVGEKIVSALYFSKFATGELSQGIKDEIKIAREHATLIQETKLPSIANNEAIYQKHLLQAALDIALDQNTDSEDKPYRYSTQGHIIVDVRLSIDQYQAILNEISGQDYSEVDDIAGIKTILEQKLGMLAGSLPEYTYCNLDIAGQTQLVDDYRAWLKNTELDLTEEDMDALNAAVGCLFGDEGATFSTEAAQSRSSIIALQQVLEAHMLLASEVIQKRDVNQSYINNEAWISIRTQACKELNSYVKTAYQQALIKSYKEVEGTIDIARLNQLLDQACAIHNPAKQTEVQGIRQHCYRILMGEINDHLDQAQKQGFYDNVINPIHKHDFSETTAVKADYLYTDARAGTSKRTEKCDKTAHDKKLGAEEQAHRLFRSCHYNTLKNGEFQISPSKHSTFGARVPSLSIRGKGLEEVDYVFDVADKLRADYNKCAEMLGGYDKAFYYNLLTSLHGNLKDHLPGERKNMQRKSAKRILLGAHAFNRQQLDMGLDDALVRVINMGVNQHTENLGYSKDSVIVEATLSTEMSILNLLSQGSHFFSPEVRGQLSNAQDNVQTNYHNYLKGLNFRRHLEYFHQCKAGHDAIGTLRNIKSYFRQAGLNPELSQSDENSFLEIAMNALLRAFVNKDHCDMQYGLTMQALLTFIEKVLIEGCKSANERLQAVAGRAAIFQSFVDRSTNELSYSEKALYDTLQKYAAGDSSLDFTDVQRSLNKAYNIHNLEGGEHHFSHFDQGGAAKLQRHRKSAKSLKINAIHPETLNTNFGETGDITNLSAKKASKMQAHKGPHAKELKTAALEALEVVAPREKNAFEKMGGAAANFFSNRRSENNSPEDDTGLNQDPSPSSTPNQSN